MRISFKLFKQISSSFNLNGGEQQIFTNYLLKAKSTKGLTYQQIAEQLSVNKVC